MKANVRNEKSASKLMITIRDVCLFANQNDPTTTNCNKNYYLWNEEVNGKQKINIYDEKSHRLGYQESTIPVHTQTFWKAFRANQAKAKLVFSFFFLHIYASA